MKTLTKVIIIILAAVFLITAGIATAYRLIDGGVIILNSHTAKSYEVRGVDVSSYQGDINWELLAEQNVSFAFIKATEGSSFVDKYFDTNYKNAQKTDISVGAYHFFSYDSSGKTQAENFINNVPPHIGMLPPVIDLEFYGDKASNPPARDKVDTELKAMLSALEDHYGLKPIIYATELSYELYLDGDYKDYDIWIRNVITRPKLSDGREWTFWQYTNREILDGYVGKEKFIDVNVFFGTREEFENYPRYE